MKILPVLILVAQAFPQPATAATLYRWTDVSGTPRYGYQPPPGVEAEPAEEERREVYEKGADIGCRQLAEKHLSLIDKEIARTRALEAGLGPEFAITPAAKQELILDLLAHRSAVLTGRPASEFRTPSSDEILRNKARLQSENTRLSGELKSQQATLDAEKRRLEREKAHRDYFWRWGPGPVHPAVPGFSPRVPLPVRY